MNEPVVFQMSEFERRRERYRRHLLTCARCRAAADPGVPLDREGCRDGEAMVAEILASLPRT